MDYIKDINVIGIVDNMKKKYVEKFTVNEHDKKCECKYTSDIIRLILSLMISCYAFYLSWKCNSGMTITLRIINGLFAFIFGIIYILLYLIFRSDCMK